MAAVIVACILLVAVTERPSFAGLAGTAAGFVGFLLVAAAALGRLWTSLFIAGRKDATLVQAGPYAACRHPLYALSLVAALGFGIATRSLVLLALLLAVACVLHWRAMRAEDAWLAATHGEAARHYRERVPQLFPDWSRYSLPDTLEIQPRIAWKAVVDAGSLLLAFALLQAAHALQHAGATVTWMRLP